MEFLKEKNVQRLRDIRRMQCGRQLRSWNIQKGACIVPTDIPGSSPLTDMMSITKVVPRTISPFVQKAFSVQRAFYVMHLRCIMQRRPFAEGKLLWDDVLTNVMHLLKKERKIS